MPGSPQVPGVRCGLSLAGLALDFGDFEESGLASESDPVLDTGMLCALEEDSPAMMSDTSVLDRVLADLELEAGPDRNAKAVKDDKAKAPTYMWDKWILPLCALANPNAPLLFLNWRRGFRLLREAMLRFWKRSPLRGFAHYRRRKEILSRRGLLEEELFAARDCFVRIGFCSVWEWDGGSQPFFWNWVKSFRRIWSKGSACGLGKPWSRGPGDSAPPP